MTFKTFIFSSKPAHRITRHALFWLAYILFFYVQSIVPTDYFGFFSSDTYFVAVLSVLHFLPCCVLSVYLGLYFILPFFEKKKLTKAVLLVVLLFALDIFINYFFSVSFNSKARPNINVPVGFNIILGLGYLNSIWAILATGTAVGIGIAKNWVIQQQQLLEINKKRIRTDLDIKRGEVLPDFLLNTLESLQLNIASENDHAPELIILLSDVLSYTLYDSKDEVVEVRSEILNLQKFTALANSSNRCVIHLEIDSKSNFNNRYILPLSLLTLIQHCIYAASNEVNATPNVKLRISSGESELLLRVYYFNSNSSVNINEDSVSGWLNNIYKTHERVRIRKMQNGLLIFLAFEFIDRPANRLQYA